MESIIIIAGPTAVGKTSLSLELARERSAEIVSADSRQIYRDLDIGTAKPDSEQLNSVPHHFIDELDLGETFSAGRFQADAARRISEIWARGRSVLVVGGSTLYLHALKHGLADIPPIPDEVRDDVVQSLREKGADVLYARLQSVDPKAAASMDPTKTQRLVRALEVYDATGRPLSSYHEAQEPPPFSYRTYVLNRERDELYDRINRRVDQMLSQGLLDEVESLLERGVDPTLNPLRTIGYQEPIAYLQGEISHNEMVRLIKRNTRRYAKRQLTWFRRDEQNVWIRADQPLEELVGTISTWPGSST